VVEVEHRWSAQDNMPVDGLPFVGPLWPLSDRVLCATGLRKWGLAMGTTAGEMLAAKARGEDPPWEDPFRTGRLNLLRSARSLVAHNGESGLRFMADRVLRRSSSGALGRGEGRVVAAGLGQAAVYRDDAGELHRLSARCTHLGCIVRWNAAERSWDCPCHGSRFAPATGEVLHGPAVSPLAPKGALRLIHRN
jgi:Rieske Fe-S protein